ncbi:MAG: DUF4382 domain-containing protein [Candidatus Micrarchaeota archaeon]
MSGQHMWMLVLGLSLAGLLLFGCAQSGASGSYSPPAAPGANPGAGSVLPSSPSGASPPNGNGAVPYPNSGRVVVTATDKAADMGAVSRIQVTVDAVQLHSAAGGWVSANITPHTYDLLQLKAQGASALLADVNLTPGSYNWVWLDISKVVVVDANGSHDAKLPSGTLRIMTDVQVVANQTATVAFDFAADESLHMAGNGRYILAPVVEVESRDNASVDDHDEAHVLVWGGFVRTHKKVGMDANGRVDVDVRIQADANLTIGSDDLIRIQVPGAEERGEGGANGGENRNPDGGKSNGSPFDALNVTERLRLGIN